ncbi:MAG: cobalt ECF transporter T component CbiQ [Pseudomonadota bacterium]
MLKEPFATGSSQIHSLDPRLKLLFAASCSFVVALSNRFPALFAALLFSLLLIGLARLNIWEVTKRMALVNGLVLFFWLVIPVTYKGTPLFHLGPLQGTMEGVLLCTRITLKSNTIFLVFVALVSTMPITTLGHAMNRLRLPGKLIHLLLLTYRYIFVIDQEYQRLIRAAKIRGFRPRTTMNSYRTYAYLIGMLFVRASARAERVHQAMVCRGFDGRFYCLRQFSPTRTDWMWSGLMILIIFSLVSLEWAAIN